MQTTMDQNYLLNQGYEQYKPSPFDGESVKTIFQKVFRNEDNKRKYFLTWKKWVYEKYADSMHPELKDPRYEGETQLCQKKIGQYIYLTFLHGWNAEDAEEFLEKLFEAGWFENYDKD